MSSFYKPSWRRYLPFSTIFHYLPLCFVSKIPIGYQVCVLFVLEIAIHDTNELVVTCVIGGLKFDIFEHDYFSRKYHRLWYFIHGLMRWRRQQHGHKASGKTSLGDRHHHRGNSKKRSSRGGGRPKSVRFKTSNKEGTMITSSAATHGVVDSRHGSYLWMWVSLIYTRGCKVLKPNIYKTLELADTIWCNILSIHAAMETVERPLLFILLLQMFLVW